MNSSIVKIGNSKGVRLPKVLLEESGIEKDVQIIAKKGEIRIIAVQKLKKDPSETSAMSEAVLAKDWLRPEEDAAWASLQ